MKKLFFDYNSTTPVREEVIEEMIPFFAENFGNPSSVHQWGQRCGDAVEKAREKIARALNVMPEEIIFTSGGSESNSTALIGTAWSFLERKGNIVVSSIEHPSILQCVSFLENLGFSVTRVDPDTTGVVQPERIKDVLRNDTFLVSIMHSNNETGALQPVKEIAHIARERGIRIHSDAVQSVGKVGVEAEQLGVDLLSLSAHKLYGPKGVGALYVNKGTPLSPIIFGGGQEKGRRGGTQMVPQIVGAGVAAELGVKERDMYHERLSDLRDRFEVKLLRDLPGSRINAGDVPRLPNTSNIYCGGVSAESIMIALDLEGIAVSTGSACHSGTVDPSHVLTAMGLGREEALSSLRISFGRTTTIEDALFCAERLKEKITKLDFS